MHFHDFWKKICTEINSKCFLYLCIVWIFNIIIIIIIIIIKSHFSFIYLFKLFEIVDFVCKHKESAQLLCKQLDNLPV